ncbi:hypothetical protein JTB14_035005 [Gonioctena quinquepunctata]|nr:hypothetical protein JTB14_035005 [Gonioctena quinquepunctata]
METRGSRFTLLILPKRRFLQETRGSRSTLLILVELELVKPDFIQSHPGDTTSTKKTTKKETFNEERKQRRKKTTKKETFNEERNHQRRKKPTKKTKLVNDEGFIFLNQRPKIKRVGFRRKLRYTTRNSCSPPRNVLAAQILPQLVVAIFEFDIDKHKNVQYIQK